MDEQAFRAAVKAEGFQEPREITWEADYAVEEHVHDFDAKLFVISGQLKATMDGEPIICGPGDIFNYTANMVHTEGAGPDGAVFLAARR